MNKWTVEKAECEGQTNSWTAVLACLQAASRFTCHGQTPLALALTTLQGDPDRQLLVQKAGVKGASHVNLLWLQQHRKTTLIGRSL